MNSYPLVVSQDLVFRAKQTTLLSSASAINTAVSGLGELTEENVASALDLSLIHISEPTRPY